MQSQCMLDGWLGVLIQFESKLDLCRVGEDVRSAAAMSYRDKWNLLEGPARVLGPTEMGAARKKKPVQSSEDSSADDEEDRDPIESRNRRRKRTARRTKFYKVGM